MLYDDDSPPFAELANLIDRHHLVELLGYQCMKIFTEWRQFNSFKIDVERLCMKEYSNHLWTRDEITQHTYRNKLKQIFFINFDMNSKIKQLSTYLWTHISELIDPIFDKVFNDEYNKNMFNESNKLIVNNKSCDKGLQSVGFEKVLQNTTPPSISNNNRLTKSNDVSDIQSLPPLPQKIAHSSNHHSKNDSWNLNDSERNDDHNEIDNQKDATYPLVYYSGEDYSFFCRECRIRSKRLKTNTYRIDNLDIFNKRVQSANTRFPVPASRKRNYNRSNSTGLIKTNSKSTGSRYIGNQKESNKFGDCDNPQISNKSNKSISPLIENQSKLSSFPKTDISSKIEGSKKSVILDQENTYFDLNVNHEQMRKIPENENRNDYQSCTKQSPQERKHIDDDILEQIFCKIINSVSSTEDDEALAKSVGTQTALTGEKALVIRKKSSTTRRSIAMTKNDSCTEEGHILFAQDLNELYGSMLMLSSSRVERSPRNINHQVFDISRNVNKRKNSRPTKRVTPAKATNLKNPIIKPRPQRKQSNRNVKERCIEYSGLLVEQQIESIFPNKVDTHTQTIVHCPGPSTASKKRKAAFNTRSSFQTNSANNNLKPRNNTSKKGIVRVPPNKKNINTTRPDDKALTNKTRLSAVQRKFNDDNEGIISKSTTFIKETENDNTGKGNRQHDDQIEVTSLNKMNTLGMHENLKTKIIELVPLNLPIRKNSTTKVYGNHTNATDSELKQNLRSSEQGHKSMSSADLSHGTSEPKLISKTTLPSESSTSNVTSSISHDIMSVGNSVMDMTKHKKDDSKFVCEKRVCQHPHQQMINMLPSEHLNKEPFNSNCMKNKIKRQKNVAVADSNFTAPTRFINSSSERVYEEIIDCDDDRTEVAEIHRNTQSNFNRNQVKSTKLADKPKICQDQCKSRIDPLSRKRARLEDIEPSQHIRNCFRNKCLPAKGSSSTVPAFKIDNGDSMSSQIKNDGKQVTSVVDKQPPEVILEKNKSNPINDQSECKNCVNIWKTSKYVDRKTCKDNEIVDSKSANDADNRSTMASFEVKSNTAASVPTPPITMQRRSFEIAMDRIRTTSQQGDLTQRKNIEIKKVCDSQKYKQSKDIISMNQGKYIEQQSNLHDKHNNPLERKVKDASKSVNNNRQYSTEPLTSKAVTGKVHCSNDTTLNKTGVASTVSDNVARKTYELNNSRQMFRGQKQDNNDRRYRGTYSSNRHLDYIAKVRRYENRDIHNSATRAGNPFSKIADHGCCSGPYGIGRQRRQNEEMTEQERNTLLENLQLGGYSKNEAHRIMNFNTKPNVVNDTYYCPISKRDPRRIPPIYLQQQGRPYSTIMDNHSAGIKIDQSDQTQIKDKQETKLLNKQLVGYHDSGTAKNTTSEKKSSENLSGRDGYAGCNKDNMNSCWWNPTGLFELNETESSANYRKVNDEFLKKLKKLDNVNYHKFFPDMWAKQMLAADNETLKRITLEEAESLTQSNNKQMHHVEAGANMEVTEINNKDIQLAQTIKGDRQILSCAKDLPNENKTQTDLNAATSIHLLQDENDKSVLIDRYNTDYNIEIDQIVATMSELINNSELCDAPLSQSSDNPDIISADLKSLPSFDYYGSTSLDNVNDYPNCEISTKEHKIETYESVVDKRDKLSSKNNTLAESSTLETVSQGEEIGKQGTTSTNISKQKCHSTSFEGDSKHLIQSHKDFSKKRATNKHHIFDFPKKHSSRKHKRYEEQHHKHSKTKKNYKNEGKSDNVTSVGGTVATPTVIGCTEIRPTNLQKLGRRLRSAVHLVKK